jgi:hypothetical protein
MYFSKKQYFRDTTAPAGLSETIPIKNVPAVSGRYVNIRNPETIDRRNDYYGNELLTIKDRNGVVRQISLMKGANKPRGIDGKVKWSMAPNKFRRGRGLRTDTSLFYELPKRREMGTEFFKSRYQSAFDEMLIAKKIRDSEKLGANQIKTLNETNKKLQDRLDATLQSNKLAQDRLAQDSLHHNQLLLAIANTSTPSVININTPAGNAAAALAGGGGAGGIPAPAPSPSPEALGGGAPAPAPAPREPTAEEIRAFQAQAAAGGGRDELLEAVRAARKPSELKALRAAAKADAANAAKGGGGASPVAEEPAPEAEKPAGVPIDFSKLPPPDTPKGKGKGKKGKAPPPPPEAPLALEIEDKPLETTESAKSVLEELGSPAYLAQLSKVEEAQAELLAASTPRSKKKTKKQIAKDLKKEAGEKLKLTAELLGETATATTGGEKSTSTPRPTFEDPLVVKNPLADLEESLGKEAVKQGQKKQTASQFLRATGLPESAIENPKLIEDWIKTSSSKEEMESRYKLTNEYLSGVSKTLYSKRTIDNEIKKLFPPAPDPPAFASFGAAEPAAEAKNIDFHKPSFPHEELGEIVDTKPFMEGLKNSKFKNPVALKFGNDRVGGFKGEKGQFGYVADFDDVKKTFDALPVPKKDLSKWKTAKWRIDNWDSLKDKPYEERQVPKENPDGTLAEPPIKKNKKSNVRVNELWMPTDEIFASAFGFDLDRNNDLAARTKAAGGQAEAKRRFKKGQIITSGGVEYTVKSQKGDSVEVENNDGEITLDLDDID